MSLSHPFGLTSHWSLWREFQVRGAGFSVRALTAFHQRGSANERRLAERSVLRTLFEQLRLQEALVWQNPTAARFGLYSWLATPLQPEKAVGNCSPVGVLSAGGCPGLDVRRGES